MNIFSSSAVGDFFFKKASDCKIQGFNILNHQIIQVSICDILEIYFSAVAVAIIYEKHYVCTWI